MTEPKKMLSDTELDDQLAAFFAQEQKDAPLASDELMMRILADANTLQPRPVGFVAPMKTPWWKTVFQEIGGWPSLAGLSTAAVIGVWIGLGSSSLVTEGLSNFNLATALSTQDEVDPFSGLDFGFIEG